VTANRIQACLVLLVLALFATGLALRPAQATYPAAAAAAGGNYAGAAKKNYKLPRFIFKYAGQTGGQLGDAYSAEDLDAFAERIAGKVVDKLIERGLAEGDAPGRGGAGQGPAHVRALAQHCASCHTAGQNPKGGYALFDKDGILDEEKDFWAIYDRVTHEDPDQRMPPPPKQPLDDGAVQALRDRARQQGRSKVAEEAEETPPEAPKGAKRSRQPGDR
jgi:hypothetical protein